MSEKVSIAKDYLFFRYPTHHILILIPIFIGTFQFFFLNNIIQLDETNQVIENQKDIMETYLITIKLTFVVLLSFFTTYRWAAIINDGSYAYWITQGVHRMKLVYFTLGRFLVDILFAEVAGLSLIIIVGGFQYSFLTMIYIILLLLSNTVFLLAVAFTTGIFIRSPELAALSYIFINVLILLLSLNFSIFLLNVLQSDLRFESSNPLLWFSMSLIISTILIVISFFKNNNKDLEL